MNEIKDSLKTFGMAVITPHPMNYAIKHGPDLKIELTGVELMI